MAFQHEAHGTKVAAEIQGAHNTHISINGPDGSGEIRLQVGGEFTRTGLSYLTPMAAIEAAVNLVEAAVVAGEIPASGFVLAEVSAERLRQVCMEGYDAAHDDRHPGEMARAAAAYANEAACVAHNAAIGHPTEFPTKPPHLWPWEASAWKPKAPRRALIIAMALMCAEVERMDREAVKKPGCFQRDESDIPEISKGTCAGKGDECHGCGMFGDVAAPPLSGQHGCHDCNHMPDTGNCAAPGDDPCFTPEGYALWEPKQ